MAYFTSFLISFSITVNLLFILQPLAIRIGLVDSPNDRKHHQNPVPLIGGIAMFCGFLITALLIEQSLSGLRSLFAGAAILIIVGVLDDFRELSPKARFIAEIMAALLVSLGGGAILYDLGPIFMGTSDVELGMLALPITVFSIVGVINALNMSDGIDGLAGGFVLIALFSLVLISSLTRLDQYQYFWLLLLLIAVVIAFLGFNKPKAVVFMGDAGSMFLGFMLAWFLINMSQGEQRTITPITALWILAVPLIDTVSIMIRRMLNGGSPFKADREHFHHFWLNKGFTVPQTLLILLSISAGFAFIGLMGLYFRCPENIMFWSFMSLFALYLITMMIVWQDFHRLLQLKPFFRNGLNMFKKHKYKMVLP